MRHTSTLQQRLTSKWRSAPAFTLVEMLVASVAGAVLIVLVAQMATSGLQTVGLAGGRMVSASKMHDLRSRLAADLALVPDPQVSGNTGQPTLRLEASAGAWTLDLWQPAPGPNAAWKQVHYQWLRSKQTLVRSESIVGTPPASSRPDPQTLVTGLIDWQVECLADPAQPAGPREWNEATRLPATLLCRASLSSIREEGRREDQQPASEKGRDYEWRLPIAGGGGSAP